MTTRPVAGSYATMTIADITVIHGNNFSLTAGAAYIGVLIILLAHQGPPFKHVKDKK